MFSSTLRSTLIALVASAVFVAAEPSLSLKVSSPSTVDGVQNLKVVTTLTNTGDESLKLLNDPRGILNTFPTNSFAVTDATGATPAFVGAKVGLLSVFGYSKLISFRTKVKYVPSGDAKSFTVLTPGQSIDVSHDRKCIVLGF